MRGDSRGDGTPTSSPQSRRTRDVSQGLGRTAHPAEDCGVLRIPQLSLRRGKLAPELDGCHKSGGPSGVAIWASAGGQSEAAPTHGAG